MPNILEHQFGLFSQKYIGNVLTSIFWENAKYFGTSIWLIFPEIWECPRNMPNWECLYWEHQFSGKMPNILEHQFGLFSQKYIGNVLTSIFWENAKYFGTSIWLIFPEIYWECLNINFLGKCQIFWNINLAYFPRNILGMS